MNKRREIQIATSALFATSTRAHGWLLVRAPSRFYRVLTPSLCSSKPSDSSTANSETKMAAVEQQKTTTVAASPNTAAPPPAHPIALNPDEKINFTLVAKTVSVVMCSWIVGAVNASSSLLLRAFMFVVCFFIVVISSLSPALCHDAIPCRSSPTTRAFSGLRCSRRSTYWGCQSASTCR